MPFCRKLFKKDPTLADAAFGLDIFQKEEGPNTDSVIFPFPTVKDFELATRAQKEAKKKKEEEEKEAKEKEEKEEKEKEKQKKEKEKKEKEKKEKEKQRKKQKEKQKQKEKKKQRRRKHRDTSDSDEDTEEWTDDMVGQALEAAIKTAAEAAADAAQQAHQSALSQTAELSVKMLIEKMKPLFEVRRMHVLIKPMSELKLKFIWNRLCAAFDDVTNECDVRDSRDGVRRRNPKEGGWQDRVSE
eukprot:SAG31_NODE_156_length_22055_cov_105.227728_18_plen_243_part_00